MISYMIRGIIPILIFSIVTYGIIKKVKVYDCFIEGVKDGIALSLRVFPYILAMLVAVGLFKESGALKACMNLTSPIVGIMRFRKIYVWVAVGVLVYLVLKTIFWIDLRIWSEKQKMDNKFKGVFVWVKKEPH